MMKVLSIAKLLALGGSSFSSAKSNTIGDLVGHCFFADDLIYHPGGSGPLLKIGRLDFRLGHQ